MKTPITLITGPLGSGKTTLLRHLLDTVQEKLAILMNEFGEIAIDSKVVEGKNIQIAELGGGCVCCSLLGEFEAAVEEVIDTVHPDLMLLEATGVAEPDALIFDIQESLQRVRLDGVVTVADADSLLKYPTLGHTTRMQVEAADVILLNKIDLVSEEETERIEQKLRSINETAEILRTERCRVDPDLLFGIAGERAVSPPSHIHQPEFESFTYVSKQALDRDCFERFATHLTAKVYRAKGFVRFREGSHLFNFVGGRWELEPFESEETILVFIGKDLRSTQPAIIEELKTCERRQADQLTV